jgi:8-oxo-dGTP diphosphatase
MRIRNKATPAVYIFLIRENKILLARRFNTGYEDGKYQVPAGHVEEGELPSESIIRETKEEINVDLIPEDLECVHVSYRPKHDKTGDRIDFFFRARKWKGEEKILEPDKCDQLKWFPLNELPENVTYHVKSAFEMMQKKIFYDEINSNTLKKEGLYKLE